MKAPVNPHERAWKDWVQNKLAPYLYNRRGRASELARHLCVGRQSVSRWAAVATNIWFHGRQQSDPFVPRSGDNGQNQIQLVLPQADNVPPESDKP